MPELEYGEPTTDFPAYTLHPIRGVVWAAFWGTPVAAGIVMAINYRRVGNGSAARKALVLGLLATVALFVVIFAIPGEVLDSIPNAVFYVPQLAIVHLIAKSYQHELVQEHSEKGGVVASAWPSVGIGVLCLPLVLGALFATVFLLEPSFGTVIEFGNDEVYYSGDANEDDANRLARLLQDAGIFGSAGASVRLHAVSGRYTVSFVLVQDAWHVSETVAVFRHVGEALAVGGFPTPLTVELCDEYFAAKNTIQIE